MNYKYYNANPKGIYTDDCVLRAISVAEGISWNEAHYKLSKLSNKEGRLLNEVIFVEDYLDHRYPRKCFKNMKVGEFAKICPKGNYLVTMKGHIVAVVDNLIIDTWDCSNKIIKCCWLVKD